MAHALESHKTLSGEDVEAVIEGKKGRGIDGRAYKVRAFMEVYGAYHERLVNAHVNRVKMAAPLPKPEDWAPELFEVPALGLGQRLGARPRSAGRGRCPPGCFRWWMGAAERLASLSGRRPARSAAPHIPPFAPGPGTNAPDTGLDGPDQTEWLW